MPDASGKITAAICSVLEHIADTSDLGDIDGKKLSVLTRVRWSDITEVPHITVRCGRDTYRVKVEKRGGKV